MECNGINISPSLFRLIEHKHHESQCLRLLYRALNWERTSYLPEDQVAPGRVSWKHITSRLLNPELPGDYFSFREQEGMISFMPKGKLQIINDDGSWPRKGRQSVKPGKWIRSMLHPRALRFLKTKDHSFAEFNAIVRHEELRQKVTFLEVPVDDAYDVDNFKAGAINSCMWGEPVGPFYRAFGCKAMVSVGVDGVWRARAILWRNVQVDGGAFDQTFMDRIYADSAEVELAMKEHAQKEGWWRKAAQDRAAGDIVGRDGETGWKRLRVETKKDLGYIKFYPYLDTFHSGGDSYLTNGGGGDHEYQNTDGTRGPNEPEDDHEGEVVDVNGDWISEDVAVSVNGEYYHSDSAEITYCETSGEYVLLSECYRVRIGRDWQIVHRDNVEAMS